MDEGLHYGQQLVQDHSDALVAKKFGNAFEVNRSNEVFVLVEDERVGLVQSLVSPQEVGSLGFGLVPLHRLRERDVVGLDEPVDSGSIQSWKMSNLLHGPISTNQILPREKRLNRDIFGTSNLQNRTYGVSCD